MFFKKYGFLVLTPEILIQGVSRLGPGNLHSDMPPTLGDAGAGRPTDATLRI